MRSLLVTGSSHAVRIPVTPATRIPPDRGSDVRLNWLLNGPGNARLTATTDLATGNILNEAAINPELLASDYLRKAVILLLTAKSAGCLKIPAGAGEKSGLTDLATGTVRM